MSYTLYKSSVIHSEERRFEMGNKYLTFEKAKAVIAPIGLKTRREYLHYVKSNNINYLSPTPEPSYYHKGWKGFADYLGISQEEYVYHKNTQPKIKSLSKPTSDSSVKAKVEVVNNVLTGLDPDKVIAFLIQEDVAPETIVKLVADLDIKSSTMMNDLCKYMHERSKRQAEVWRPTGYTTAEAQMTSKI